MLTYPVFIRELQRLVDEAVELRDADDMDEDPDFRKWRHDVQALLHQIAQVRYLLPTQVAIQQRSFGGLIGDFEYEQLFWYYQRDIDDTINELNFIIDSYAKYGEPTKSPSTSANDNEFEYPSKITVAWLHQHVPYKFWLSLGGIILAAFVLGVKVGDTQFYRDLKAEFTSSVDR